MALNKEQTQRSKDPPTSAVLFSDEKQCRRKAQTCYISMSLNKQFVLGEATTKEQGIDEMPSFVHAFYNVASSVLQEKESGPSFQAIFREGLKCTYRTRQSRGRSQGCRGTERTLGTRLIVYSNDVTAAILVSRNTKMAAMLVKQPIL